MNLLDLVQPETLRLGLAAADKVAALEELVDALVESHHCPLARRGALLDDAFRAERRWRTRLGPSVAVAVAEMEGIGYSVGAAGRSDVGFRWGAAGDEAPTRLCFLLCFPRGKAPEKVEAIGGVDGLLGDPALREALVAAADGAAFLGALRRALAQPPIAPSAPASGQGGHAFAGTDRPDGHFPPRAARS